MQKLYLNVAGIFFLKKGLFTISWHLDILRQSIITFASSPFLPFKCGDLNCYFIRLNGMN
jgi:hypothetical protein